MPYISYPARTNSTSQGRYGRCKSKRASKQTGKLCALPSPFLSTVRVYLSIFVSRSLKVPTSQLRTLPLLLNLLLRPLPQQPSQYLPARILRQRINKHHAPRNPLVPRNLLVHALDNPLCSLRRGRDARLQDDVRAGMLFVVSTPLFVRDDSRRRGNG
jgi:hypothetical protein